MAAIAAVRTTAWDKLNSKGYGMPAFRPKARPAALAGARGALAWAWIPAALVGAAILVSLFARASFSVGGLTLTMRAGLGSPGLSRIEVPPLGAIEARTDSSPFSFTLTLDAIHTAVIGSDVDHTASLETAFVKGVRATATTLAARILALAVAGGALAALAAGGRRWAIAGGGAVGLVAAGVCLLVAFASFNPRAFSRPTYTGSLANATWIAPFLQTSVSQFRHFEGLLATLPVHLRHLFASINRAPPLGVPKGAVPILVVSDMHDNAAALGFTRQVAATFRVRFVLDAGDETYLAMPMEAKYLKGIASIPVPYLVAPGNHDSAAVIAQLRRLPNVTVLNGQEVREDGIPIIGIEDAASLTVAPSIAPAPLLAKEAHTLKVDIAKAPRPPAIIVIHNFALAPDFAGLTPVVVTGHSHTQMISRAGPTWIVNPGTTGAGGVRGLFQKVQPPYGMAILYMVKAKSGWQPYAVDTLLIHAETGSVTLKRTLLLPPGVMAPTAPAGSG